MSKPVIELVSITYRVDGKQFTKKIAPPKTPKKKAAAARSLGMRSGTGSPFAGHPMTERQLTGGQPTDGQPEQPGAIDGQAAQPGAISTPAQPGAIAPHPEAATGGCGPGARCVNGFLEILVCFGSVCQWQPTNTPCNC